jgi:3-methyl-2-oxobutanoate hydroxymethyltransferase
MRIRTTHLQAMVERGERIVCVTAYDYPTARIADAAGLQVILVGDSLGNVVLGYDSTLPVTMEEMLHHVKAVTRGVEHALVVADMPFMSYQVSVEEALRNAGRFMQEAGAHAVKLEGGERSAETVRRMVEAGIPVMGHIGFTPQSVHQLGGYRVQGRGISEAQQLIVGALAIEEAGAFALVLEMVPTQLALAITEQLTIPTIGIGAGLHCDGQIQVLHDLLGLGLGTPPKHAKLYADLGGTIVRALQTYAEEVRSLAFPGEEHGHSLEEGVVEEVLGGARPQG